MESVLPGPFVTVSGLPQKRELAALLGDLTVAWSHAERISFFAFWVASGMTQTKAFDVYESLSGAHARMKLTIDLLEQDKLDHPAISQLRKKMSDLVMCGRERNALVHRTWVAAPNGELFLIDNRMPNRAVTAEAVSEASVQTLVQRIHAAADGYIDLLIAIYPDAFRQKVGSPEQ
jgi:hypothetical protein